MVFSRKLDELTILRRVLNANYANRANFAKSLKIRAFRSLRDTLAPGAGAGVRVQKVLFLEKIMPKGYKVLVFFF
jgi:hypothetical protein